MFDLFQDAPAIQWMQESARKLAIESVRECLIIIVPTRERRRRSLFSLKLM